ncbi:MAG: hypothetical protein ACE5H8_10635 [Alphaproteobacteria bacterium]
MILRFGIVAGALAAFVMPFAPARAAPQVLALVASNGSVPLVCDGETCAAEFTAFCLQETRPPPPRGTVYRAVGGAGISVAVTAADGRRFALPADDVLRIDTVRGYAAVRISLPASRLRALGATGVTVAVGEGVSLVPEPVAGDPDPLDAEEIAATTGPLRAAGTRLVERDNSDVGAARLTGVLINALPAEDGVSAEVRRGLWRNAVTPTREAAASPEAIRRARAAYDRCNAAIGWHTSMFVTLRDCLGYVHDHFIGSRNRIYWEAVRSTS